jgi:serine/threonine protein kinase
MDNSPFSEEEIMIMFANIALSLLEVNSRGIFHRDLKPDNMLIQNSEGIEYITLTDFGASKYSLSTEKKLYRCWRLFWHPCVQLTRAHKR